MDLTNILENVIFSCLPWRNLLLFKEGGISCGIGKLVFSWIFKVGILMIPSVCVSSMHYCLQHVTLFVKEMRLPSMFYTIMLSLVFSLFYTSMFSDTQTLVFRLLHFSLLQIILLYILTSCDLLYGATPFWGCVRCLKRSFLLTFRT